MWQQRIYYSTGTGTLYSDGRQRVKIHYLHRTGVNSHLNKISRCALHKCDVSYVPASGNFLVIDF